MNIKDYRTTQNEIIIDIRDCCQFVRLPVRYAFTTCSILTTVIVTKRMDNQDLL